DFVVTDHYASVDGKKEAGEVDVYYGRRGQRLDPTKQVPDIIFYGDEPGAKLGITVSPAGDVNGDGRDDLLIGAAFHSVRTSSGSVIKVAGQVYLVYGGFLNRYGCTVKVRAQDI